MTTAPLAPHSPDALPAATRRTLLLGAVLLHVAALCALLQLDPVRRAVGEVLPITVDWIAPPAPATLPPPPPPPKRTPVVRPKPVIVSEPVALSAEPAVVAPPPPQPVEPAPVIAEPVVASPAPPPPPPPAPPAPRTIAISAVEYLSPPVLSYPTASRRLQEQGQVQVAVLVDARGLPQQMSVIRSSGHARLDDAALATVRATRFKPYTENGSPLPFWVVMPLVFELE